jgi:hypothetical protein
MNALRCGFAQRFPTLTQTTKITVRAKTQNPKSKTKSLRFRMHSMSSMIIRYWNVHQDLNGLYGTIKKIDNWKTKTYNRRDSQMVTHSSTSRPVQCLCMAERTGCPVLTDLWSYVLICLTK